MDVGVVVPDEEVDDGFEKLKEGRERVSEDKKLGLCGTGISSFIMEKLV